MNSKRIGILLILITILAFFLRIHGINYYSYGDEAYHVYNSLGLGTGQLPQNFHRIALFLFYSLFYAVGWILGIFTTPKAFIGTYFTQKHVFYFSGRLFEALAGTAAVPFLYLLGKRIFSRPIALAAAFFLAVVPVAVEISQIARGQALAMTLVIGAMYFACRSIREKRTILYILAGLSLGAAVSIRIYCLLIFLPVVVYLWTGTQSPAGKNRPGRIGGRLMGLVGHKGLWLIFVSFGAIFIISYPEIILRLRTYVAVNLGNISGSEEQIYLGSEQSNSWKYYLLSGFPAALSWPLYLVFIAGSIRAIYTKNRDGVILAFACLVYFLFMGKGIIASSRYLFPIIPACLLLAADCVCHLSGIGKSKARWRNCLFTGFVLLLTIPPVKAVVESNRQNRAKTTKNLAEEWIFKNIPYGSKIAVERMGYSGPDLKLTPVLDYWIYNLGEKELKELLEARLKEGQPSFALEYFINHPPEKKYYTTTISVREIVDLEALELEGYEYIVTVSSVARIYSDPLVREKYPEHCRARREFYEWLSSRGELIKIFTPGNGVPGEELKIYRITGSRSVQ